MILVHVSDDENNPFSEQNNPPLKRTNVLVKL